MPMISTGIQSLEVSAEKTIAVSVVAALLDCVERISRQLQRELQLVDSSIKRENAMLMHDETNAPLRL